MDVSTGTVECLQQANAILGEGPVWDRRTGELFWVDIRRGQVFRFHLATGEQTGQWAFAERVGCVALTDDPRVLVVASGLVVHLLELATGETEVLADLSDGRPRKRFNDGEVDARGRLWIGTMLDDYFDPKAFSGGELLRIDPDGSVEPFGEYQLPNGIGWSLDQATMYINDSAAGITYALDFDAEAGRASNRRPIFTPSAHQGIPDGMSVDADGDIWCAMWDGWALIRLAPDGTVKKRFEMPVRRPSSATFCGEGLDRLAITSATVNFTSADYAKSPKAGGLFVMFAGCRGQNPNLFALRERGVAA